MTAFSIPRLIVVMFILALPSMDAAQAASRSDKLCTSLWETAAACAYEDVCNEDTVMFLPSASRSVVVAAERQGFSLKAFESYCLQACKSKTFGTDEETFSREVCTKKK